MFRDFAVDSFSDFTKTVGLHFWPFETYENLKPKLDKRMSYEGRGFVRYNTKDRAKKTIRQQIIREYTGYYYDLFPRSKEMLLEYRDLVAQNGSKLLVFLMVRFYTSYLTPAEYGTADLITQTANLLIPLVSLDIADAVFRFAADRRSGGTEAFRICGDSTGCTNRIFAAVSLCTLSQ